MIGEQQEISLQLTADEILYLREKAEFPGGYQWKKDIAESVMDKLEAAYQKPIMTQEEYKQRIDKCREYWLRVPEGLHLVDMMVKAEEHQLKFHYEIKGGDEDA